MKISTSMPIVCLALGALVSAPCSAATADAPVTVELNKLEDQGGGCRVHLVILNTSAAAFDAYKLDLVLFGRDGIIARRIAVEIAPLRANKKSVKLFDVADLACPTIGSILVNDVLECSGPGATAASCIDGLQVSSRAGIELSK